MLRRSALAAVLALAVLAVPTVAAVHEAHRAEAAEARSADLALAVSNDSAQLDRTFRVSDTNAKLAAAVGDSLAVSKRLVVQVAQQGDAVDKALQLERRGRYALTARVDSLQRQSLALVHTDSAGPAADRMRRAHFDVRQPPYTVAAEVALPATVGVADTARLDLRVSLDPIPVVARLSCAAPNRDGIRAASIEATAPTWAAIDFTDVQQSPDLCASPALTHASGRALLKWKPVVIGAGYVAEDATHRGLGVFVGTGFALGSR